MKCSNCGKENLLSAKYCAGCGSPFTDEERQAAYDKTFYGKLDKIKEAKSWISLNKITSNIVFRILFLAAIIALGILGGNNRGTEMTVLESSQYRVYYNEDTRDYFLATDMDSVSVELYLPGKPEGLTVMTLNSESEMIAEDSYNIGDRIVLPRDPDKMYIIEGDYEDTTREIRMMIVPTDADL